MITDKAHNCRNDELTKSHIENFGVSIITIPATDYLPSFAYTIGLWQKHHHPEIICFGLRRETLHIVLNDVAELVKNAQIIKIAKAYHNIFANSKAEFLKVDNRNLSDYFGMAIDYYKSNDFPVLQLVWTDRNNKFPWETDFEEEFIHKQPLLDRNVDFKFREAKNLGIFTTRHYLELNKPILSVIHETNGDWQFLTGDEVVLEDMRLVALEEIVIKDRTLNEVFDLEYGQEATRTFIGGHWTRNMLEESDDE